MAEFNNLSPKEAFRDRVLSDLLPAFCNDPARNYDIAGFRDDFRRVDPIDADNFLKGFDAGVVFSDGNMYRAHRSRHREQLFTEGSKKKSPRSISLWLEVFITIGTLGRLHFDFGWPIELLGSQSAKGEFDVTAFLPENLISEHIACEVKKSATELQNLVRWMSVFGADPSRTFKSDGEKNAFNKVAGLRLRRAPIFWAVGPGASDKVFKVSYADDGLIFFHEAPIEILRY